MNARLAQWIEYENQFDKIINWLTDGEASLKTYGLKGSLEEKQEQLNRFEVYIKLHGKKCNCFNDYFYMQDFQRLVESWNTSIQDYIALADQLEQVLIPLLAVCSVLF